MIKPCQVCGKKMEVRPSLMKRKKYCSKECMAKGRKGVRNSKRTEFYKGMKGTRFKNGATHSKGYVLIFKPGHPRVHVNGYVNQHILVWEESHGHPLPEGWVVHHYNGIRDDNRPENLVGMPKEKHHPALDPGLIKERLRIVEKELQDLRREYEKVLSERGNPDTST